MNAIIEFINELISGGTISVSTALIFVIAFLIYKIVGKHIDEFYSKVRKKKTYEKEIGSIKADLISAYKRNEELEKMLVKFIDLSNRQKILIMQLDAQLQKEDPSFPNE